MADARSLQLGSIWANTAKDRSGTDYIPLVDVDGHLQVDILSGGGSNASVVVDDSAFTVASGSITVVGCLADETTPDSVNEGDVGAPRMTLDRKQLVVLADPTTDSQRLGIDASGFVTANINGTVTIDANSSNVTVDNAAGASAVNIQDGGNSITVDGTVAATQSGVWNVGTVTTLTGITNDVNIADGGNSITVDALNLDIRDLTHVSDSVGIGDGVETLNITAAGEAEVDIAAQSLTALKISATAAANAESNPIFVQVVDGALSGQEVLSYDTAAAVAKDATDNHDYAVTAANTFKVQACFGSASGAQKIEIQAGPVASLVTKAVVFTSSSQLSWYVDLKGLLEVDDASTGTVRLIRTNFDNQAQDLYSTIIGNLIPD